MSGAWARGNLQRTILSDRILRKDIWRSLGKDPRSKIQIKKSKNQKPMEEIRKFQKEKRSY
jgi:hypothetical protein